MADQHDAIPRSNPWLLVTWVGMAILTLYFAFTGWMDRAAYFHEPTRLRAAENAAFLTFHVFGFSEVYASPENVGDDWRLLAARWLGSSLFVVAAGAATFRLFGAHIASLRAALGRGHTLIIGDHEMATALIAHGLAQGLPMLHLSNEATVPHAKTNLITLPRSSGEDPLDIGRANQARRVIVAERDLGASAELALRARGRASRSRGASTIVAVHLDDPATAELIHHVAGNVDLFTFSEAKASARVELGRHPPFLLARQIGATSVQVLIIGFNWLGQALAKDIVVTSLTSELTLPSITVIDADPTPTLDFLHRHPEFDQICNFEAVRDLEESELFKASKGAAVCGAYICLADSAEALAAAVTLRERAARFDAMRGPIFVRLRSGGLLLATGGVTDLKPLSLYSFASLDDAAAGSRALLDDPDSAARSVYTRYSGVEQAHGQEWNELSEESRISNRRIVSHLLAKLVSLGFDLEPWLRIPADERIWPIPIDPSEPLFRNEEDRRLTAELEHRRWVTDRRLNGWRYGVEQDDRRKIHPDLIPFDELPASTQDYHYKIADWLDGFLPRAAGGLKRG